MSVDKPSDVLSDQQLDAAPLVLVVRADGEVSFWLQDSICPTRAAAYLRRAAAELDKLPPLPE